MSRPPEGKDEAQAGAYTTIGGAAERGYALKMWREKFEPKFHGFTEREQTLLNHAWSAAWHCAGTFATPPAAGGSAALAEELERNSGHIYTGPGSVNELERTDPDEIVSRVVPTALFRQVIAALRSRGEGQADPQPIANSAREWELLALLQMLAEYPDFEDKTSMFGKAIDQALLGKTIDLVLVAAHLREGKQPPAPGSEHE